MLHNIAPFFIVGHPRSGTTLLSAIIDRHSACASTPESHYFNKTIFLVQNALNNNRDDLLKILKESRFSTWGTDWEVIRKALDEKNHSAGDIFDLLVREYGNRRKITNVFEKTPVHIRHIDDILAVYPQAKFIWIIRDGRSAASSLKKVDWATNDDIKLSKEWNRNMSFGLSAALRHPKAIHIVKYEGLIEDAESTVSKLMAYVDLQMEKSQLIPSDNNNLISPGEHSWKRNINKNLMSDRINAWQKELSIDSTNILTQKMNYYLTQFEYLEKQTNWCVNLPSVEPSQKFMLAISVKLYKCKHWLYAKLFNRVPR